jgi:hypothetical protein
MAVKAARRKDRAAVTLGWKGGEKGGPARAAKLTSKQRSQSARRAVHDFQTFTRPSFAKCPVYRPPTQSPKHGQLFLLPPEILHNQVTKRTQIASMTV